MSKNIRLDVELVSRKLIETREKAKNLIKQGYVKVNGSVVNKASSIVFKNDILEVEIEQLKYVSRGGYKLEKILNDININLENKVCVDIGASTGGFTDCMLQQGAKKVYAVDVGKNQLHQTLLQNNKVINMENTNIRNIDKKDLYDKIEFISIDVSFISLELVLPVAFDLISDYGEIICLIKPQFEAGISNVGKNGLVKSSKTHFKILTNLYKSITDNGYCVKFCTFSPIKGAKSGNIEYLFLIGKSDCNINIEDLDNVVKNANKILNNGGV